MGLHQIDRVVVLPGGQRVVDRLGEELVLGEPTECGSVEFEQPIRLVTFEAGAEELGEDAAEPVPVPVVIRAVQEQLPLLASSSIARPA